MKENIENKLSKIQVKDKNIYTWKKFLEKHLETSKSRDC